MATTDSIKLSGTAQQTSFALRLASAISSPSSADGARGNVAFSPLSLHVALGLIAAGACGATRDQLVATLGAGGAEGLHAFAEQVVQLVLADSSGAGGPRVSFASAVFSDASLPLKPSFEEVAVGKYRAETRSVDFKTKAVEVAGQVNSWVDQVTSGLIKEILPGGSIDADTRLVLGNALYFKGTWAQKFHASDTKDDNFHLLDKTSIKAPFMSSKKNQYISSFENLKVLKLPYQQGGDMRQFSMYILLPKAQDGLWSLAGKLTSEPEFLEKHIPVQVVPIGRLKIPKFKISFDFEASKLFKSLGLQLPFSTEADLSEMVESPLGQSLCVSSIFHKSFVEVNEEGTEAAAATVAVAMCKSLSTVPPTKVDFVADHPFLFVIREDVTSVVLFVGHVINPLLCGVVHV